MALESRDDRPSGMFSASVSNAIGSDGSAADQKVPFPLLFARETEAKRTSSHSPLPPHGHGDPCS